MLSTLFILLTGCVLAKPDVSFPINAQVPPVAQASIEYSFQFSPSTFTSSTQENLSYELQREPAWLQLDSTTKTLYGTPTQEDVGSISFQIQASDGSGTASMQVTIVVVDMPGPQLSISLTSQLAKFGILADATSLTLQSGASFDITFEPDTFASTSNFSYYATSADRSPLPSWVLFNNEAVTFSGVAPGPLTRQQTFDVLLIASGVPGFSESTATFSLIVGTHQLAFEPFETSVNITNNTLLVYTSLQDSLMLDGQPISNQSLASASAELPDWLSFNSRSLIICGSPPAGVISQDVIVNASDTFGDNASAIIHFYFQSMLFEGEIGPLNATMGQPFKYTIDKSLFAQQDISITMDLGVAKNWLQYDPTTLTLSGIAPTSAVPSFVHIVMSVTSNTSQATESQTFSINILKPQAPNGSPILSISTSTSQSATNSIPTAQGGIQVRKSGDTGLSSGAIAAAVICPIIGTILLVALCASILRRRSRHPHLKRPNEYGKMMLNCFGRSQVSERDGEKQNLRDSGEGRGKNVPFGNPDKTRTNDEPQRRSAHSDLNIADLEILGNGHNIGLDSKDRLSRMPYESIRPSGDTVSGLIPEGSNPRWSDRLSQFSQRSAGLPFERMPLGLGHGRASNLSNVRDGQSRKEKHRRTWSSSALSPQTRNVLEAFPDVPAEKTKHISGPIVTKKEKKGEIRLVDDRTFEEQRQSYIRQRASSNLSRPLFTSGPSRENSHTRKSRSTNTPLNVHCLSQRLSTYSQSSSLGVQGKGQYPRVTKKSSGSTWETCSSLYSARHGDEREPGEESFDGLSETDRTEKRAKWSRRLGRDIRGESFQEAQSETASITFGGKAAHERSIAPTAGRTRRGTSQKSVIEDVSASPTTSRDADADDDDEDDDSNVMGSPAFI